MHRSAGLRARQEFAGKLSFIGRYGGFWEVMPAGCSKGIAMGKFPYFLFVQFNLAQKQKMCYYVQTGGAQNETKAGDIPSADSAIL